MSSSEEDLNPITPRRSARNTKLSLRALEALSSQTKKLTLESDDEPSFSDEREIIKDTVLQRNQVSTGKDIFSFQKRKKHEVLKSNLEDTCDSENESQKKSSAKTPHKIRSRIKKGIVSQLNECSSEEDAFAASGSDYSASCSSESSDSESDTDIQSSESEENVKVQKVKSPNGANRKSQRQRRPNPKYIIKTEDYFSNNSSKKIHTSNHTLDKLKTPRLSQDQLQKLLGKFKVPKYHEKSLLDFTKTYSSYFSKWMYLLHENFNILLYGLGSKQKLLEQFHQQYLDKLPVIVVSGFFPSLTIKDILDSITVDILELKESPANPFEACELIKQEFAKIPETHLYIILHNIEGDMLRNSKSQSVIALLAAVRNIHLIASIDHINAPLIWNHFKLSKFNFTWWDVTSFLPYLDETAFESSMMVQRTGNLALSSLRNVFLSLTTNSKGIYLVIVKYQLKHGENKYYQGMLFKDLYSACREAFLVSSDLALRAQLTEFVDHKMVKFKRALDGSESLVIPINNQLLDQFLNEHDK